MAASSTRPMSASTAAYLQQYCSKRAASDATAAPLPPHRPRGGPPLSTAQRPSLYGLRNRSAPKEQPREPDDAAELVQQRTLVEMMFDPSEDEEKAAAAAQAADEALLLQRWSHAWATFVEVAIGSAIETIAAKVFSVWWRQEVVQRAAGAWIIDADLSPDAATELFASCDWLRCETDFLLLGEFSIDTSRRTAYSLGVISAVHEFVADATLTLALLNWAPHVDSSGEVLQQLLGRGCGGDTGGLVVCLTSAYKSLWQTWHIENDEFCEAALRFVEFAEVHHRNDIFDIEERERVIVELGYYLVANEWEQRRRLAGGELYWAVFDRILPSAEALGRAAVLEDYETGLFEMLLDERHARKRAPAPSIVAAVAAIVEEPPTQHQEEAPSSAEAALEPSTTDSKLATETDEDGRGEGVAPQEEGPPLLLPSRLVDCAVQCDWPPLPREVVLDTFKDLIGSTPMLRHMFLPSLEGEASSREAAHEVVVTQPAPPGPESQRVATKAFCDAQTETELVEASPTQPTASAEVAEVTQIAALPQRPPTAEVAVLTDAAPEPVVAVVESNSASTQTAAAEPPPSPPRNRERKLVDLIAESPAAEDHTVNKLALSVAAAEVAAAIEATESGEATSQFLVAALFRTRQYARQAVVQEESSARSEWELEWEAFWRNERLQRLEAAQASNNNSTDTTSLTFLSHLAGTSQDGSLLRQLLEVARDAHIELPLLHAVLATSADATTTPLLAQLLKM